MARRVPSPSVDRLEGVSSEAMLDALPHGVLVIDRALRVRVASPRYCEMLATSPEQTEGCSLFEVAGGLWNLDSIRRLVAEARVTVDASSVDLEREPGAAGCHSLRVYVRRLGPRSFAATPSAELLFVVENRGPARAPDAALDVTARLPVTKGAIAASDDLLSRASHELRGPFGSIANWVHLLSDSSKDAALVQQGLAAIQRAVKAGSQIVDDLYDLAQLRAGRLRLSPGLVDLASILDTALEKPRAAALEKGVTLEVRSELPSLPVMGDPIRLHQILLHLLTNAVKFTPPGGRVDVVLGRDGECWQVAVRDTGRGVPEQVLPSLFDGLRLPGGSEPGSLGVGLAIARHLAVLHGGSVEASSAGPGQGSSFALRLPVPALAPSRTPQPAARSASGSRPGAAAARGPDDSSARIARPIGVG